MLGALVRCIAAREKRNARHSASEKSLNTGNGSTERPAATSFAPSPTGKLHVGNVRTALFAYLYAKHTGGKFVLRIEDTDLERSHAEFTEKLMEDMKWLGLDWDEGPGAGGKEASYKQSERLHIYQEYADKLIAEGRAFHCYCTTEEVEAGKKEMEAKGLGPVYNGRCRKMSDAEKSRLEAEGRKPVTRFIPYDEDFAFNDIVKGPVNFPKGMVGDFVIMRANGIVSRMCLSPQSHASVRSTPRPKPPCGTVP